MRSLITFVLVTVFAIAASAAQASIESLEELLLVTKADSVIEADIANTERQVAQAMQQGTKGKPLSLEEKKVLDGFSTKYGAMLREELGWAKLKPIYIQIYRSSLEQEEVDGLIAFYKTVAGKAAINKMPTVNQKAANWRANHWQSIKPKLDALINQLTQEAKLLQK